MINTNICTVRYYNDGTALVSVNGKDIRFVRSIQAKYSDIPHTKTVTLQFDVAQYNVLLGDEVEPAPPPVRGGYVLMDEPKKPSLWVRLRDAFKFP